MFNLPKIIMGTWQAGKSDWAGIEDQEIIAAIQASYDNGITAFDTAAMYGNGHSERILGEALKKMRSKTTLISKAPFADLTYDGILKACEQSLKNLQTTYLNIYLVHWPAGSFGSKKVPLEETMKAMQYLKDQGMAIHIGVSNFDIDLLKQARELADISVVQSPYSLFWRQVEADILPYCQQNDMNFMAYSPLAQGLLTGRFRQGHTFPANDHRKGNRLFQGDNFVRAQQALDVLEIMAREKQISMAQLAIAWICNHGNVSAVVGARNAQQAENNAKAGEVKLAEVDMQALEKISRIVTIGIDKNPVLWGAEKNNKSDFIK